MHYAQPIVFRKYYKERTLYFPILSRDGCRFITTWMQGLEMDGVPPISEFFVPGKSSLKISVECNFLTSRILRSFPYKYHNQRTLHCPETDGVSSLYLNMQGQKMDGVPRISGKIYGQQMDGTNLLKLKFRKWKKSSLLEALAILHQRFRKYQTWVLLEGVFLNIQYNRKENQGH